MNFGVHFVRDAFRHAFDNAALLTNDTDLVAPVRIVTREPGMHVTLLTPTGRLATTFGAVSSNVRYVHAYIGPCPLPDPVPVPGKRPISKPASWWREIEKAG